MSELKTPPGAPPRIFIGGTGRCGTTLMYRSLGCHRDIYSLPREMRFITDSHGLINLVDALTGRYSHVQSREALYHFERLMRVELASPGGEFYPGHDLPGWLGGDKYFERLDQFRDQLVEFEFEGLRVPLRRKSTGLADRLGRLWPGQGRRERGSLANRQKRLPLQPVPVVRFFAQRSQMTSLAAGLVEDLFSHNMRQQGKRTWCEKSPANLQNLDFLRELFPDSIFVHMLRDPRGVAASMQQVNWAPADLSQVCHFLARIYQRWDYVRSRVDLQAGSYVEVRLEDFVQDPGDALGQIALACGLPDDYGDLPEISATRVRPWQERLQPAEVRLVEDRLGEYIEAFGYPI